MDLSLVPDPAATSAAAPAVAIPPGARMSEPVRDEVGSVVARLRATFATGRTRDPRWRREQLAAIERLVVEHEADIAAALAADLRRPALDAWFGDVASVRTEAAYARRHVRRWMKLARVSLPATMLPGRAFHRDEPLGVVLVIGPWNFPVYLSLGPMIGALAAGNCVILKPSEQAPATSRLLARLVPEYLDGDAVAVVEGAAATTQDLLARGLDHAFFTGGTEIGKLILAAAAPHLTPVTLELGGKSPAIVTRAADLEVTARRIVWSKFMNSGQTCVAPDYVLVDAEVRDQFVTLVGESIAAMYGEAPTMLPIVNAHQYDRLAALLAGTGGRIAVGGQTDPDTTTIAATVVVDPDPESALMREEIFGPVLPVLGVPSLDAAIDFVTSRPKPLAAYLFSSSRAERDRVLREISAGGTVVNHAAVQLLNPRLPFGGVGASGMGAYHGRAGFETFSHRKSVLLKRARPDFTMTYPPYTARTEKIFRRIF
jgi:aldehyde dehydrogenase (NAD+)